MICKYILFVQPVQGVHDLANLSFKVNNGLLVSKTNKKNRENRANSELEEN